MTVKEFFGKVAKEIGYDLISSDNNIYDYIHHRMMDSRPARGSQFFIDGKETPLYFLMTTKIIVREKFCTILLVVNLELLNREFSSTTPVMIYKNAKEYSFKMKNEKDIENYDFKTFVSQLKQRITEIEEEGFSAIKKVSCVQLD
ncbi:MAG: hypothetical protein N3A54_00595 [Patescibacteria group bacterium]|nr:hypothetical protein [Patescibacteria group bacterium]